MKIASGAQNASYFASNGTAFTGSTVTVSKNGVYTVYAADAAGNTAVKTITISGIGTSTGVTANISKIIPGKSCWYIITINGDVYSWGYNNYGQLGLGTTTNTNVPTKISGLSNVSNIVVNDDYSAYAVTTSGNVYSWGYNNHGQLGIGSTTYASSPTQITTLSKITKLVAKDDSVFAFTSSGNIYAWGYNAFGQLGTGSTDDATTPTLISNLSGSLS
jgi:alpha-tubulin suppressor-like RCC1 family protein